MLKSSLAVLGPAALLLTGALAADHNKDNSKGSQRLVKEVRHELVMLPYYNVFDNLSFQIEPGGKVILSGSVTRPTLKSSAENVVKSIEGVEHVENRIEVLPLSPNDDNIRRAVFSAIYGQPGLDRYAFQSVPSIHIIVKNGNVVLEGVVNSEADKNMAGLKAKGVAGVFSVTNNLRIES
jgi:hyperosmotically inducible protein